MERRDERNISERATDYLESQDEFGHLEGSTLIAFIKKDHH